MGWPGTDLAVGSVELAPRQVEVAHQLELARLVLAHPVAHRAALDAGVDERVEQRQLVLRLGGGDRLLVARAYPGRGR